MPTIPHNFDLFARPYQQQILTDDRKNKVLVIHRRAGKSSLAINKLIHDALWPGNEGKIYYYLCPTQKQAKEVVWKAPDMLNRYLPREVVLKRNEVELTIYLQNQSQIHVKGGDNPDALRGTNPYGVILDEYAQMKPEVYNEILRPVLAANGGWVWFIGTPKSKDDFYLKYNYAKEHSETWQALILRASESGIIPTEALKQAQLEMKEAAFAQEFECLFQEGAGTIFRRIRENIFGKLEEPVKGKQYKMGVDLARHQDWTVITIFDRHTHQLVYFDRFNQIDWQLQKARIEAVARRYNDCPITIDSTGVGDPIAEDLRRLGLVVNDFKFTAKSKKDLIEYLAIKIEQNLIKYPEIPELIRELEDYTYEMTPSGHVKYSAPPGMNDDCVCSLALAVWQIGEKLLFDGMIKSNYGMNFNLRSGYAKKIF